MRRWGLKKVEHDFLRAYPVEKAGGKHEKSYLKVRIKMYPTPCINKPETHNRQYLILIRGACRLMSAF